MKIDQSMLDFTYARAAAILSQSFCGDRIDVLLRCQTVADIALTVFPQEDLNLPEKLLVSAVQRAINQRCLEQTLTIIKSLDPIPATLNQYLAGIEYLWLKQALNSWIRQETPPPIPALGPYTSLHCDAWPDLAAITRNTRWAWLPSQPQIDQLRELECRLDSQYYAELLSTIDHSGHAALRQLIHRELAIRNAGWALRMRRYYGWTLEQGCKWFVGKDIDLLSAAKTVFSLPVDNSNAWSNWRFRNFLPDSSTAQWSPDPVIFEQKSALWLYRQTWHLFHTEAMSVAALYAFCRLKEFEAETVASLAEGLQLGIPIEQMRALVGGDA